MKERRKKGRKEGRREGRKEGGKEDRREITQYTYTTNLASSECPTSSKGSDPKRPPTSRITSSPPGCSSRNFVTSYTLLWMTTQHEFRSLCSATSANVIVLGMMCSLFFLSSNNGVKPPTALFRGWSKKNCFKNLNNHSVRGKKKRNCKIKHTQ